MLAKSEICQKCANCCKEFWLIEYNRDWALRWSLLEYPKIDVDEREIDNRKFWIVTFKIKCKKLRYDTKEDKFYCEIHDGDRPQFCRDFPDNIPITEWEIEKDKCPIIKDVLEKFKEG